MQSNMHLFQSLSVVPEAFSPAHPLHQIICCQKEKKGSLISKFAHELMNSDFTTIPLSSNNILSSLKLRGISILTIVPLKEIDHLKISRKTLCNFNINSICSVWKHTKSDYDYFVFVSQLILLCAPSLSLSDVYCFVPV